jgi:hypothetical protein
MAHKQNYSEKIELKKQQKREAGLVSDRFPQVSGIVIHMTYYHNAENPVLMERTVNVFPNSYAYFNMECMIKDCDNGGFDLTKIIAKQIKHHKKLIKGKMACKGDTLELDSDHATISYQINIKYSKNKRSH